MGCDFVSGFLFFFKQKTAYEMRISDWSSDVCSSDLAWRIAAGVVSIGSAPQAHRPAAATVVSSAASRRIGALLDEVPAHEADRVGLLDAEIGRASCRERVCQYV